MYFLGGLDVGYEKMKGTKGVTQGFLVLLTFRRMGLVLIEMRKLSFGHFNMKCCWISK